MPGWQRSSELTAGGGKRWSPHSEDPAEVACKLGTARSGTSRKEAQHADHSSSPHQTWRADADARARARRAEVWGGPGQDDGERCVPQLPSCCRRLSHRHSDADRSRRRGLGRRRRRRRGLQVAGSRRPRHHLLGTGLRGMQVLRSRVPRPVCQYACGRNDGRRGNPFPLRRRRRLPLRTGHLRSSDHRAGGCRREDPKGLPARPRRADRLFRHDRVRSRGQYCGRPSRSERRRVWLRGRWAQRPSGRRGHRHPPDHRRRHPRFQDRNGAPLRRPRTRSTRRGRISWTRCSN